MPTSSVRLVDHDLCNVLEEIADLLLAHDWERRVAEDGKAVYYIIGFDAHTVDVEGAAVFRSEFPAERAVPSPEPPTLVARWYTASQLAARQGRYVEDARRKLEQAGVPGASIRRFLEGRKDEARTWNLDDGEVWSGLLELGEALSLSSRETGSDLDPDDARAVARDRAGIQLREIVSKFSQIAQRVKGLDPLNVTDPQLEEASRCYLYGFHRSAVIGAAAALETHLKRVVKKGYFEKYADLIQEAQSAGFLPASDADTARVVFQARNDVVHNALVPPTKDVLELLNQARRVVERLDSASRQ